MTLAALLATNYSNSALLYQYHNPTSTTELTQDIRLISAKAKNLRSRIGERQKLNCDYGSWFLMRGEEDLLLAACVTDDYPERVVYDLIKKIESLIQQKSKQGTLENRIKKLKNQLDTLCSKYKDPSMDKVKQAQYAVKELKDQLQKGVKNLFDNQENLNCLNEKAVLMKGYAKQFEKTSEQAERVACCHKWKAFLMIGLLIGSVLIISGIIVYLRVH